MQLSAARTRQVQAVACHAFEAAGCPSDTLAALYTTEPAIALLAALYARLWRLEWDSGDWPGDFVLMQPGRMPGSGCKEFGLGQDAEALGVWLGYARAHVGEMQDMFCGFLAQDLTTGLRLTRKAVAQKPSARSLGGVEV